MKPRIITLLSVLAASSIGLSAEAILPDAPMGKQLEWAEGAPTDAEKADRLEAFWREYLPQEEGGISPDQVGYGDGSHVVAIVHCAWQLTRAYISTGQKTKALAMVDWLAKYESKTALAPGMRKAEQGGANQPATAPKPNQEGGQKPKPESGERPQ